jgi:monoterpene epsilon-lactone hydrolase
MPSQQLETLINMLRSLPRSQGLSPQEARASFEKSTSLIRIPEDVRCQPLDANGIPAEWVVTPGAQDDKVVFFLHGGGYASGSINTHRELASRISRAAGARVLLINYRLAPEHPHPAALEDSLTAYRWLLSNGVSPNHTVIAGDSAGGGLTVATLVALRDAGDPLPAAAVCLSPWVDMEGKSESRRTKASLDPSVRPDDIALQAESYLGGADPKTPLASPLYADLHGLPPLLVQVGGAETLLDDSTRLAERAKAVGVDTTLEVWDEMPHVWQFFSFMLPEGQQAIDRIGEYIRKHVG